MGRSRQAVGSPLHVARSVLRSSASPVWLGLGSATDAVVIDGNAPRFVRSSCAASDNSLKSRWREDDSNGTDAAELQNRSRVSGPFPHRVVVVRPAKISSAPTPERATVPLAFARSGGPLWGWGWLRHGVEELAAKAAGRLRYLHGQVDAKLCFPASADLPFSGPPRVVEEDEAPLGVEMVAEERQRRVA